MKTSKYKIKVVCGFRKDQEHTVDANEAHKAYYLFNNKSERGTFNDGLAIEGRDIQKIVPDYNATMGYNAAHTLTSDDYNQIRNSGAENKLRGIMAAAGRIGKVMTVEELTKPLIELVQGKYIALAEQTGSKFAQEVLAAPKNGT